MENQINIGDQNTQQIDQSPINQLSKVQGKPKLNYWAISTFILFVLLLGISSLYFLNFRNQGIKYPEKTYIPTSSPQQQVTVEPTQKIRFPFVRNGNIYLYENGQETLIAPATSEGSYESRNDNAFPFLSPNGKYLAYINYVSASGFVPQGTLKIYEIEKKETKTTKYKTTYFHWNVFNQLGFETRTDVKAKSGEGIDPALSKITFVVLDPETLQEVSSETASQEEKDQGGIVFPLYADKKLIKFRNGSYYFLNKLTGIEKLLFPKADIYQFSGWSPDGVYAIFIGAKQNPYKPLWLSINTDDPNLASTEIKTGDLAGGAGGDLPTGLKWYFNKGFVIYCMQDLFFVDGKEPLELTHAGGGGCHNEEGFVATSPNGEYAFVKFDDRFELHNKNGDKKIITESTTITKSRSRPKNLVWLNNDYMIIYENTFSGGDSIPKPKIYIFDRSANLIKPIIENGYLSEFSIGIP